MRPNRDHIHAVFVTRQSLLEDGRFMALVHAAEAFNSGSPFTLCRCEGLGKGDINFTGAVRQALTQLLWVPEHGFAEISTSEPANGRGLSVEMRLPVEASAPAEVHYRLDAAFFTADERPVTLNFLREVAVALEVVAGTAHHAVDEVLQDTTDPKQYRALTNKVPPEDLEARRNPGRSVAYGPFVLAPRWLAWFGADLVELFGRDHLQAAPCAVETVGDSLVLLRLYDDPFAFDTAEHRATQLAVREHLGLDQLAAGEVGPAQAPRAEERRPVHAATAPRRDGNGVALRLEQVDPTVDLRAGEVEFYAAQARRAAGRVLVLGSGTGSLTLSLARIGVPVVVLDASADALDHARQLLAGEPPEVQHRVTLARGQGSASELADHGPFAAALLPHRAVNRYRREELRDLLERLRAAMQPGGFLAFSTFFPEPSRLTGPHAGVPVLLGGAVHEGEALLVQDATEADPVAQLLRVRRRAERVDRAGRVVETRFRELEFRYYFPQELVYLLELTGFKALVQGGFSGESLTAPTQEVVVVARRP